MHIGLFAPYDLARPGGVTSHIRAQARALRRLGHSAAIFGPASGPLPYGEVALSGATAVSEGGTTSGGGFAPWSVARVRQIFARERFDVVHVHEPLMPLVPWSAVWLANAPVVGTFHVHREEGHRFYPIARPLLQRVARRLAARVAVSDAARRTVERYFPGEYDVIPNGIEPERFRVARLRPAQMPSAGPTVVCVGRLEPRKGAGVLIEAIAQVQQQLPTASLVLIGDGPERSALTALAERHGARVVFVRDVDDDELPAFYQAADVACAPALAGESFGIVLLEALAAGTRVVASRIDGYVAAVGNTDCVRFVAPGDPQGLAASLVEALADRETAWRADAARVVAAYDWNQLAERLVAVYQRVSAEPAWAPARRRSGEMRDA